MREMLMTDQPPQTREALRELANDIRTLKSDLYGNPNLRDKGLYGRLENLEVKFFELQRTYERERVEQSAITRLEEQVAEMVLNAKVDAMRLKAIAAGVGTILVALIGAAAIALFNFLTGVG